MAIRVGDHTTRQTLVKYDIAKDFRIHCLDSNVNFIGTQQKENANYKWDTDFDLRFIFSLDDLYLEDVGFKVDAEMSGGNLSLFLLRATRFGRRAPHHRGHHLSTRSRGRVMNITPSI